MPDSAVAGSARRLASRFYQMKIGHCLTGQYLYWTKNRPNPQRWWCRYQIQTREHIFKLCPERKAQQKILWAEEGDGEVEEPLEGPGPPFRREMLLLMWEG